jgi:hypothetical protein
MFALRTFQLFALQPCLAGEARLPFCKATCKASSLSPYRPTSRHFTRRNDRVLCYCLGLPVFDYFTAAD